MNPDFIVTKNPVKYLDPNGKQNIPSLTAGQSTQKISVNNYVSSWENQHNTKMTSSQKQVLAAGCIGITALNLGINYNPPLKNTYSTFAKADMKAKEMESDIQKNP